MAALLAVTTVVSLSATAPAGAASAAFTLDMIGGQGRVVLGASPDAPLVIETPSTIKGTVDDQTGAITGGSLSTPPIHFTQQITSPVVADVDITATFSDTTPNTGTGQVDGLGNVRFATSLDLDLHIDVGGGLLTGDCLSAPITLNLVSVDPYDPELGEVTLTDPAFAIPPVPATESCPAIIGDAINDQLSSPNNSITLGLVGALPLPPPPGEPSTTVLAQSAESSPLGHPVTFSATVAPSDATGTVTFLSGATSVGLAPVTGGVAELTTSSLPVGEHQITARYSGDVDHQPSTSAAVVHTVKAIPNVTADLPGQIVVGATPVTFTTTVSNPAAGGDQDALRLDMLFGRVGTLTTLNATHLILERQDGASWVPVPLARRTTPAPADPTGTLAGSYGGPNGFALDAGDAHTVTFRISAAANAPQGHLAVQFQLNALDGEGAVTTTFSTTNATIPVVSTARRPTTTAIIDGAGSQIRHGFGLTIRATVNRGGDAPLPSFAGGHAELLIDGQPVEARANATAPFAVTTVVGNTGAVTFNAANDATWPLTPGTHRVAVRFLGDLAYQPSLSPEVEITVHAQGQPAYECTLNLAVIGVAMSARIDIHGLLPSAAPAGSILSPDHLEMVAVIEDNQNGFPIDGVIDGWGELVTAGEDAVTVLDLSPEGSTGEFSTLVAGASTVAPAPIETVVMPTEASASIPIEGEPGDVVDIYLERFGYSGAINGITISYTCLPVGEPALLGSVTVAGTTLSTSAVGVVEEGSAVTLSASVFPSSAQGMVEFFDGATSLGFAPVSAGKAVLPTSALPQGRRSVTARYLGDLVNPASTSEAVEVTVRDVILCKNQTGTESGAVVRSTYLSLLGRCAEPAGFAFWRGRLDAGLSAEVFAGQIANTLEAHGRSVDDGYRLILGRTPDAGGRAFWAQRLNAGQRYDLLLGDLAASNEFWTAAGSTNSGYVTRLYDRLLHRTPDAAGLSYWVGRLDAGASRASVAASFVRLPEPTGQIVIDAYQAILDRNPTVGEKAPAVTGFQADGHRWKVYAELIGTTEFHDRAQTFPNS